MVKEPPLPSPMESLRFARFEGFSLDLRAGELYRGKERTHLQDKPFQMLRLLLEHSGEVVTPEELQRALWPGGTIVDFDHGIATALKKLRRALGDDADHPRYIETLARRGYRWIAGVEWVEADEKWESSQPAAESNDSMPALPFRNFSAGPERDEGLAEEILNALTSILGRARTAGTAGDSMVTETQLRRIEPDITLLKISGRLILDNSLITVETAIRRLVEEGARKLVIDLATLNAIDSSGIGLLVTCSGHMEQNGGQIRIAGARGAVAKALGMVHVDRIAPLDTDVETSCRHFAVDSTDL